MRQNIIIFLTASPCWNFRRRGVINHAWYSISRDFPLPSPLQTSKSKHRGNTARLCLRHRGLGLRITVRVTLAQVRGQILMDGQARGINNIIGFLRHSLVAPRGMHAPCVQYANMQLSWIMEKFCAIGIRLTRLKQLYWLVTLCSRSLCRLVAQNGGLNTD